MSRGAAARVESRLGGGADWHYSERPMSEGIVLPHLPRPTLLEAAARVARLEAALPQIRAVVAGETDLVAIEATLASLLWQTMAQASWCGFYRRIGPTLLAVGPYQGSMGCMRIEFERGVCGAAARTGRIQLVPDVDAFPGHIACDDATRSELVVPFWVAGELAGVLDLDAPMLDAFCPREAELLDELLRDVTRGAR